MSYNNQPDWETYKPTIKECAPKKKKFKIVIKKKPTFEEQIDDLMGKVSDRFVEKINSVNLSKDEKELLHYFSGKKNAKRR